MNCSACGAVSTGAGRCGTCGAVMPLPGEELVHDHPVSLALPLDRRGPRDGGAKAARPAALARDLGLDRREEPRPTPRSPLDPVRPVAEAAAHLLRHVAASPLFRDEPEAPARPPAVARAPARGRAEPAVGRAPHHVAASSGREPVATRGSPLDVEPPSAVAAVPTSVGAAALLAGDAPDAAAFLADQPSAIGAPARFAGDAPEAAAAFLDDEPSVIAGPVDAPAFFADEPIANAAPAPVAVGVPAFLDDEPSVIAGPVDAPAFFAEEPLAIADTALLAVDAPAFFAPEPTGHGPRPSAVPALFDEMPAAVEAPDRVSALSALFGNEPSAKASGGEPGLPEDAWRALEADVPADEDEFELSEEILMPPVAPAWRRLVAWTIDGILMVALPLCALAAATRGAVGEDGAALRFVDLLRDHGAVQAAAVALSALIAFVYLTLSSAVGGRTPGAALAGLGVVHCASGAPPTLGRAALRAALAVAGTFACFAGPLWALFDGRGQALHDKLAGTVVMVDR